MSRYPHRGDFKLSYFIINLAIIPDDQWILTFLRGCKFSLERTKEKIDLFYTLKTSVPEFWRYKYNEAKFMEILDLGYNIIR